MTTENERVLNPSRSWDVSLDSRSPVPVQMQYSFLRYCHLCITWSSIRLHVGHFWFIAFSLCSALKHFAAQTNPGTAAPFAAVLLLLHSVRLSVIGRFVHKLQQLSSGIPVPLERSPSKRFSVLYTTEMQLI